MIINLNLSNCSLHSNVFSLALSSQALQNLNNNNKNILYVNEQKIVLYPDNKILYPTKEIIGEFLKCNNYDVFYIQKDGRAYKFYDNEKSDNPIIVTSNCNSNCLMCPVSDEVRKSRQFMSIDDIIKAISQIPNDAIHLTITGGEPFLIGERIFEIFNELKNHCNMAQYLLLTNGRAFSYSPFVYKFNATKPDDIIIGIPLHGYNSETHNYITRTKDGFLQTVQGIKNLIITGNRVELRIVVSKLNYKFLNKIAEFVVSEIKSISSVKIMGLEMLGNAAKNADEVWIPYSDAFNASKKAVEIFVANGIDVAFYNFPLCAVDKEYWLMCLKSITDYKVRFPTACNYCKIKQSCGGIFAGTMRMAQNDVNPVVSL